MGSVNQKSISIKVNAYAKSNEGKQRMREYIAQCIEEDRDMTEAGARIITKGAMNRAADRMIMLLKQEANSASLPESVLRHFDSLAHSEPVFLRSGANNRTWYYSEIYFEDDLSRLSLLIVSGERAGQRTGDGIKNIVSLFNNGYEASRYTYGKWNGHEEEGVIRSLPQREALHFIENAVDKFNREWGEFYHASAQIVGESYQNSVFHQ